MCKIYGILPKSVRVMALQKVLITGLLTTNRLTQDFIEEVNK